MIDTQTKQPLRVLNIGTAGPYIRVTVNQLDDLRRLLDSRGVAYWVAENVISWEDGPFMAVVNLGRGGDAALVQSILDNAG